MFNLLFIIKKFLFKLIFIYINIIAYKNLIYIKII